VVVDTEEDFDWTQPFSRDAHEVKSLGAQRQMTPLFRRFGIRPTYVLDYPVVDAAASVDLIRELSSEQKALIGAHLQPWVNPPFDEELSERNSYPGNLLSSHERRKLDVLTDRIAAALGERPRIYKAGRYGLGRNSFAALQACGYLIDMSAVPGVDMRHAFGPDFRSVEPQPYWVGDQSRILELPMSRGFTGVIRRHGPFIEPRLQSWIGRKLRLGTCFALLGLLDSALLSPEGNSHRRHAALLAQLIKQGIRVFTLSYHSPSLMPGNTPYVRSDGDLQRLMRTIEQFFEMFFGRFNGIGTDPVQVRQGILDGSLLGSRAAVAAH
jgi:hypothetical protein